MEPTCTISSFVPLFPLKVEIQNGVILPEEAPLKRIGKKRPSMKTPPKSNPLLLSEATAVEPLPTDVVPATIADDFIKSRIFTIRGVQVMLDRDLAILYGVPTKALNQAVKRNLSRFPEEFSFLLTKEEQAGLVTNCDRFASAKHSSAPIRAFSEHGVIMVASILKSDIAAATSVRITRAFVAMRKALTPTAVAKFNKQNPPLSVKPVAAFHDRFLILDGAELYHFGASLKDLGRQYGAVTKMDAMFIPSIMERI